MMNVRWNSELSRMFTMTNGVRQGAILSAVLYCVYTNELFERLRRARYGCWVGSQFLGIYGYSDDNLLIAPSLFSLQKMLFICQEYVNEHSLVFSTDHRPEKSKTKCMAFVKRDRELPKLWLCGNQLPWVSEINHLGSILTNKYDGMKCDIMAKRARFIGKSNEIMQEMDGYASDVTMFMNGIFNTSFYGCQMWDMQCAEFRKLENSWNTSTRLIYNVPRTCHRYLIETLGGRHLRTMIMSRFIRFIENVKESKKANILRETMYDVRSVTGANLEYIRSLLNLRTVDEICVNDVKRLVFEKVPEDKAWVPALVDELVQSRDGVCPVVGMTGEECQAILDMVTQE